jgi:hypothetical protein
MAWMEDLAHDRWLLGRVSCRFGGVSFVVLVRAGAWTRGGPVKYMLMICDDESV